MDMDLVYVVKGTVALISFLAMIGFMGVVDFIGAAITDMIIPLSLSLIIFGGCLISLSIDYKNGKIK